MKICFVQGMTKRRHNLLRSYFVESVWFVVRKDPEMMAYYKKYAIYEAKLIKASINKSVQTPFNSHNKPPHRRSFGQH